MGILYGRFLSFSLRNYKELKINIVDYNNTQEPQPDEDYFESKKHKLEEKIFENYLLIIVFISMFMESYIYDYGARILGDNYIKKHIDKLDVISKWVIIPKIITTKEIDKKRHSFEIFKKVISLRNKITHWKSYKGSQDKLMREATEPKFYEQIDPLIIFESILDIFKQLENIDNVDSHKLYISEIEKELKKNK